MPSGHGPPIVRMHGAVYHVMGSLFPAEDVSKFVSIYRYDPEMELANRLHHSLDDTAMKRILGKLQPMVHTCNPLIEAFKTAVEQMKDQTDEKHLRMVLSSTCRPVDAHEQTYNISTSKEIATVVPLREVSSRPSMGAQSIVLSLRKCGLQIIHAAHPLYDALHYLLL